MNRNSHKRIQKAISPLIASVILIAFTIAIAIIVTGAMTSVSKSQTEQATKTQKCPSAALEVVYTTCSNSKIKAVVSNVGQISLSNFTMFADINGNLYTNSSIVNANTLLASGSTTTFEGYTSYTGQIAKLRISAGGDCPGVYIELKNDTSTIGTC